jgi:hypothetical protein
MERRSEGRSLETARRLTGRCRRTKASIAALPLAFPAECLYRSAGCVWCRENMRLGLALLVAVLGVPSSAGSSALLESLPDTAIFRGCGCTFTGLSSAGAKQVVFSSNYEGVARVSVGGAVVELAAIRADAECSPSRVGGRCVLKYQDNSVTVVIKARATWVCPEGEDAEACEVVRLRGQLSGHMIGRKEVVEVQGECGC